MGLEKNEKHGRERERYGEEKRNATGVRENYDGPRDVILPLICRA